MFRSDREKRKYEVEIEFIEGQQSVSTLFGPSNDHLERRIHLSKIRKKTSLKRCILSIVLMLICWSLRWKIQWNQIENGRLKSFKSEIDLVERRCLSVAQLFDGLQTERKRWQYEWIVDCLLVSAFLSYSSPWTFSSRTFCFVQRLWRSSWSDSFWNLINMLLLLFFTFLSSQIFICSSLKRRQSKSIFEQSMIISLAKRQEKIILQAHWKEFRPTIHDSFMFLLFDISKSKELIHSDHATRLWFPSSFTIKTINVAWIQVKENGIRFRPVYDQTTGTKRIIFGH